MDHGRGPGPVPGPGRGRSRGRGQGNPRENRSRSGGRQFEGSSFQPRRRYDPQPGWSSSRGRREKYVFVPKHQEGQNLFEAMSGVSDEVNSAIASDSTHNGNSPPLSSYHGSSLHVGEENNQIETTLREVKYENETVTLAGDCANKLDISCQQGENSMPLKETQIGKIPKEGKCENETVTLAGDFANKLDISCQPGKNSMPLKESQIGKTSKEGKCENETVTLTGDFPNKLDTSPLQGENSMPWKHGVEDRPFSVEGLKTPASDRKSANSESSAAFVPLDICPSPKTGAFKLKPPLLDKNRAKRNARKQTEEGLGGRVLRPGMVLLKSYISTSDQIKIVKQCRELGKGPGGFYQPGYRDGAQLHLNMMCLGKNWDPDTSKYGDYRPTDRAKPPDIPIEFYELVEKAIQDSNSLLKKESKELLPHMTPDICIVNFYSASGRLGLHQDRDESPESIRKKLPVVSFSIGDAAEFKYGDLRDDEKADGVLLESGDVLLFGGDSRNVFHGVKAIRKDTAPKILLEETNLRCGRLNLTFRQY